jgi:spermidine synthase
MDDIKISIIDNFSADMLERIAELYRCANWISPDGDTGFLKPALQGSTLVAGAFVNGNIVGIARVLSDGVSDAYIQDVVVDPDFRKQGIGAGLINILVERLQKIGIDWIGLVGEPGTEKFYSELNWVAKPGYTLWQFETK